MLFIHFELKVIIYLFLKLLPGKPQWRNNPNVNVKTKVQSTRFEMYFIVVIVSKHFA